MKSCRNLQLTLPLLCSMYLPPVKKSLQAHDVFITMFSLKQKMERNE